MTMTDREPAEHACLERREAEQVVARQDLFERFERALDARLVEEAHRTLEVDEGACIRERLVRAGDREPPHRQVEAVQGNPHQELEDDEANRGASTNRPRANPVSDPLGVGLRRLLSKMDGRVPPETARGEGAGRALPDVDRRSCGHTSTLRTASSAPKRPLG